MSDMRRRGHHAARRRRGGVAACGARAVGAAAGDWVHEFALARLPSHAKWLGLLGSMLLVPVIFMGTTTYAEPDLTKPATVVFVCLHGSVKIQVAAAHFNRIAKERVLPVIAVSRGIAVDKEIPASIREGLAGDGPVPASDVPVGLTSEEVGAATKFFAFDEVPADVKGHAEVTYWSDVPPATKDYVGARSGIVRLRRWSAP